jgi:signal recognition particle receptor subunit beta
MSTAQELKIVFAGPMGAGKTTAIGVVSDLPPVSTEVANNDQHAFAKEFTTVGLDFGQLELEDGTVVRLYGTPGQERFSFMWEIIGAGAIGTILLLDATSSTALSDLRTQAQIFRRVAPEQPFVIGVGRTDPADDRHIEACTRILAELGVSAPVLSVDVRKRADVLLLIETLLTILEARAPELAA